MPGNFYGYTFFARCGSGRSHDRRGHERGERLDERDRGVEGPGIPLIKSVNSVRF